MVAAAEKNNVKLLAGHTHSFDAPIRKMRDVIESGAIGDLVQINSWNYNAFNPRPWPTRELQLTHGPVLNQGPHQVDIGSTERRHDEVAERAARLAVIDDRLRELAHELIRIDARQLDRPGLE